MTAAIRRTLAIVTAFVLMFSSISVSELNASSEPKLNKTKATLETGATLKLKVKNVSVTSVKWSTGKKTVATVSKSGKVKGVKAGKTNITATVKRNKKTIKLKCAVTVTEKGTKNVSTQSALSSALYTKGVKKIVLKSQADTVFTIPQGNYSKIALEIDVPNSRVVNYGIFESITIKSIKRDSYTECANGNSIKVTAISARIVVSQLGSASLISLDTEGANIEIEAAGALEKLAVNGKKSYVLVSALNNKVNNVIVNGDNSIVSVVPDSNVGNIMINAKADVIMDANGIQEETPVVMPEEPDEPEDGEDDTAEEPDEAGYSASIGNSYFDTLQEAIDSAGTDPLTITLLKNIKEDIKIWPGNSITLDLNGYDITNKSKKSHTITLVLDAGLNIVGEGVIDNTGSRKAAVYNNGFLYLNGGTFTRSKASDTNSFYTIVNHGRLTINDGATVGVAGQSVTLIQNGYTAESDYVSNVGISKPTLTLNGGVLLSGDASIENAIRGNIVKN